MDNLGQPQDPERKIVGYRVYPAIITLIVLSVITVILGALISWWVLAAIPFIYLGVVYASPNFNMIGGGIMMIFGFIGMLISGPYRELGLAICAGAFFGWLIGGIEKALKVEPIYEGE